MLNPNVLIVYVPIEWNKNVFPKELERVDYLSNKHYDKEAIFGDFEAILLLDKHVDINTAKYRKFLDVKMRSKCHIRIFFSRIKIKNAKKDGTSPILSFFQLELESQEIVDFSSAFQAFKRDRKTCIEFIIILLQAEAISRDKDVVLKIFSTWNFSIPFIYCNLLFYKFQGNFIELIKIYKVGKTVVDDYQHAIVSDGQGLFALIINLLKTSGSTKNIRNISMRFFMLRFFSWFNSSFERKGNDDLLKAFMGYYQYLLYGSGNADIYRKIVKNPQYQIKIFEKLVIFDLLNQSQLVCSEPEYKLAQLDKLFYGHVPTNEIVMKFAFMISDLFNKYGKMMDELSRKRWYVIYSPKEKVPDYDSFLITFSEGLSNLGSRLWDQIFVISNDRDVIQYFTQKFCHLISVSLYFVAASEISILNTDRRFQTKEIRDFFSKESTLFIYYNRVPPAI